MEALRYVIAVLALLASLGGLGYFLSGCDGTCAASSFPAPSTTVNNSDAGTARPVDIYVDATPSMKGFLADSQYRELVTNRLIGAAPYDEPTRLFGVSSRFTDQVQGLGKKMQAASPSFYASGDTDLAAVLDSAGTDHLTVIVTDLFQSNQGVANLGRLVESKFIDNGLSVGIMGIKMQFNGKVYDVGLDDLTFDFTGQRPVYLLLLGPLDQVTSYLDGLNTGNVEPKQLILSPNLLREPLSAQMTNFAASKNLTRENFLDDRPAQFAVDDVQADSHYVNAEMDFSPSPHVPSFWKGHLSAETESGFFQDAESCAVDTMNRFSYDGHLSVTGRFTGRDSLRLRITAKPQDKLTRRGVYRFDVALRPKNVPAPPWVTEWTMPISKLQEWEQNPQDFDGTTTLRLKSFVSTLWRAVAQKQQPTLGWLTLYLERT